MVHCTKSFREDLKKEGGDMTFSEESRCVIFALGQRGVVRTGKISATAHCHSCLKNMPEGLIFCEWAVGLPPDEDMINKIKARFQALMAPYCHARINRSRGKRHGDQPWQEDH